MSGMAFGMAPTKSPVDAGGGLRPVWLAVRIGAASVSLPRDTVIGCQCQRRIAADGDWPIDRGLVAQLVRAHA